MNALQKTATEIVGHIRAGEISATECTQQFLAGIKQKDGELNSFLSVADASAMEQAEKVDAARKSGAELGILAGLPIAIKDGICTDGLRTTAGSKMLEKFVPPFNATIVQRLIDAGAIIVGKTNMDEFAMGSSTENSAFGPTANPWNKDCVPGGSSGGSAAAVAGGLVPVSIGSDTGGSIRQPAAFCGVTGLKPTYGRVSRFGLIAFASSLDQIGPFGRSAEECALLLSAIAGHDAKDSTSSKEASEDFVASLNGQSGGKSGGQPLAGIRIGVCKEHFDSGLSNEVESAVRAAIEVFKELGASVVDVQLPHTKYGVPAYYVIAPCEASSNLARFDGVRYTIREKADELEEMYSLTRAKGFGEEVKRRIMIGTYALSSGYYDAYYLQASKVRRLIKNDYETAFESVDIILGPTTPNTAFGVGEHTQDPLSMYLADVYTVTANLAGVPGISLPCGFSKSKLPVGLQLQAAPFKESVLLQVAHQYQQQTDWHSQRPKDTGA